MSTSTATPSRVLADIISVPSSRARAFTQDALLVITGAAVVGAFAQISIPLWPVPITGQTLGVMLVGAALGARRGGMALVVYMIAGLAGLPIFAEFTGGPASVLKPSFGFVIGFIGAAWVAGWVAERHWGARPIRALLGMLVATLIPFLVGVPYMAYILNVSLGAGLSFAEILAVGVTPFLLGGVIKSALAAGFIPLARAVVERVDGNRRTKK